MNRELLIFLVLSFGTCANVPNKSDNLLPNNFENEIDFQSVGVFNSLNNNLIDEFFDTIAEKEEEDLDLSDYVRDVEAQDIPMALKRSVIKGSYGSLTDMTTVDGGSMVDSYISEHLRKLSIDSLPQTDAIKSKFQFSQGFKDYESIEFQAKQSAFFIQEVISENVSEASDAEYHEKREDCFEGRGVHRYSMEWIESTFIPYVKSGNQLLTESWDEILDYVEPFFRNEKTIINIPIASDEELIVVGDIHGQFDDLVRIFEQNGYPSSQRKFIFNGDIIDRGSNSIGCLLTLFLMKIYLPESVYITRGNHESHTCGEGTFKMECYERLEEPLKFFVKSHEIFDLLPLGYTIQNQYFVCHGGLPQYLDLDMIKKANKPIYTPLEQFLMMALLWNDPHEGSGMAASKRGGSTFSFGKDVTSDFLKRHKFNLLIRSHEYHMDGFCFNQDGLCLTIFSAPNYCGMCNKGTVMKIKPDLSYEIVEIKTPPIVENTSLKRNKERSWTLNLEDTEDDTVIVFPFKLGTAEQQEQENAIKEQQSQDSPKFSWSGFLNFK